MSRIVSLSTLLLLFPYAYGCVIPVTVHAQEQPNASTHALLAIQAIELYFKSPHVATPAEKEDIVAIIEKLKNQDIKNLAVLTQQILQAVYQHPSVKTAHVRIVGKDISESRVIVDIELYPPLGPANFEEIPEGIQAAIQQHIATIPRATPKALEALSADLKKYASTKLTWTKRYYDNKLILTITNTHIPIPSSYTTIQTITYQGNQQFTESELTAVIGLAPSSSVKQLPARLEQATCALQDFYAQKGYLDHKITLQLHYTDNNHVAIIWQIQEGRCYTLRSLKLQGNLYVKPQKFLPSYMACTPGDPYTGNFFINELGNILSFIYRKEGFSNMRFELATVNITPEGAVDLTIRIQEGQRDVTNNSLLSRLRRIMDEHVTYQLTNGFINGTLRYHSYYFDLSRLLKLQNPFCHIPKEQIDFRVVWTKNRPSLSTLWSSSLHFVAKIKKLLSSLGSFQFGTCLLQVIPT